jgi:DNA-directed RNA polymerase subunit alpha
MSILAFQKPDRVIMIESDGYKGSFEFRPLEPGYGITIGNSLRRILLNSLEGYAITSVRIEGVDQEFSSIDGVIEDVTDIILNLKKIRFKRQIDSYDNEKVLISISNQETFTAGDINKFLSGFQVLNPELELCHMNKKVKLNVELNIERGRGYVAADENKAQTTTPLGTIFIDSIYTPMKNVKYKVENFRVEQKTDYEKLIIDIETDGSIEPITALQDAAKILIQHFMLFSDEKITFDTEEVVVSEEFDENTLHIRQLLKARLVDLDLSVRALNCLKAAEVDTLGELVAFNKNDLLKFRNFGKKSLTELEELVKSKNLTFGMNVAKYKLDKE